MGDKRNTSRVPRKGPKENEEKRTVDSLSTRNTLPSDSQEYQCTGDFVDDFRQTAHALGLPLGELPHLIPKPYCSLWRNVELPAPAAPTFTTIRRSTSPTPDVIKGIKTGAVGNKVEPGSKSSLLDSANAKSRDNDKSKDGGNKGERDKVKKKVSKITTGALKSDAVTPKIDQKSTISTENMPGRGFPQAGLDAKKPADRLLTSKGRGDKNVIKEKADDFPSQPPLLWPAVDGNEQKPLYVVYDAFIPNRLKEISIRGWNVDRTMVEVLCKCWTASDRLTTVILMNCGLTGNDVIRLAESMPKIPNIEFLALDGNVISEQNHGLVLSKPNSLRHLSIRYANLTDSAAQFLATSWLVPSREWSSDRPGLEFLDLSRNRITDIGLQYLVQALRFNRSLATLALAGNSLTDLAISILCAGVLTRFPLNRQEVLEKRQTILKYAPPIVYPVSYNLLRKYRFPQELNRDKARPEKDANSLDSRKKDKDDNKKSSSRMSGTRISAGNAVKGSPAPSGRVADSAHPERTKTAAKGSNIKQGASVIKDRNKFLPAFSSHSQADRDAAELGRTDLNPPQEATSQQRTAMLTDVKTAHSSVPIKLADQSDQDLQIVKSASHQAVFLSKSFQEADGSDILLSRSGMPNSVTSFIPNLDALGSGETAPDPRVMDLLYHLSRTSHHGELVITDRDVWLDHSPNVWQLVESDNHQVHHHGEEKRRALAYQQFLLRKCYQIFDGGIDVRSLPDELLNDLARLAENPLFMFPKAPTHSTDKERIQSPDIITDDNQPSEPVDDSDRILASSPVPKFHLHVTSASFTDMNDDAVKQSQDPIPASADNLSLDKDSIKPAGTDKFPDAEAKSTNSVGEKSSDKPPAPQRLTKTASAHRKISLRTKAGKGKKGDTTPEITVPEQAPKDCPLYSVLSVEERFNALLDGVMFDTPEGIVSDGNRTLKVLNLSGNKITVSGMRRLMETITRQRKEQTESLLWKRPTSPPLPVNIRPPALESASPQDSPESDSTIWRKEAAALSARTDDKSQTGKKPAGKKGQADGESASPINPVDPDSHLDNCTPLPVKKRIVKEQDDPNQKNIGLIFVDLSNNPAVQKDSTAMQVFDKFMGSQRDAYDVGKSTNAHGSKDISRIPDFPLGLIIKDNKQVAVALMMGDYSLERKTAELLNNGGNKYN